MKTALYKAILLILSVPLCSQGQETLYGPGFQTVTGINPAFSGSEGDGKLRLSYFNFYPGKNYNLHSVYLSFDSYFEELHGGTGFYLANDYLGGIINDIRGGFSYAYFLQAGENLFINAGLSASVFHRGFNFSGAVLPDQIDLLGNISPVSSESLADRGKTAFDVGAGFLVITGRFFAGFSVNHLAQPEINSDGSGRDKLKRKFSTHFAADFNPDKRNIFIIRPVLVAELQADFLTAGAGVAVQNRNISVSVVAIKSSSGRFDAKTGFMVNSGRLSLLYNYCFNLHSDNSLLPISLFHQAGIEISLFNVEKSNRIRTIILPGL